jgi:hypothetical protein
MHPTRTLDLQATRGDPERHHAAPSRRSLRQFASQYIHGFHIPGEQHEEPTAACT